MASPREELVKQAKRYKKNVELMEKVATAADSGELTGEESEQLSSAYEDAMSARIAYQGIISSIKEKGENDDHVSMIRDLRTEIDPGLSKIATVLLKILSKRTIPKAPSSLAEVKTGPDRKQTVENALSTFKAAEAIANRCNRQLSPSNLRRLELALRFSFFYYTILKSPDAARSIAMQAVDKAMPEWVEITEEKRQMAALDKAEGELDTAEERSNFLTYLHLLCHSIIFWTSMMQDDEVTDQGQKKRKTMSNQGKKETKKQENDGAESSVVTTPSNPRTAAGHEIIKEAAPIKRKLTTVFQNQSIATLSEWLVQHANIYKRMVAMMEKIATAADSGSLTVEERCVVKCACFNAMNARISCVGIISYIKDEKEENDDCPTEIDPAGCSQSDVWKVILKILDSREIPYAASAFIKVDYLRWKAGLLELLAEGKTGAEREEAVDNILSTFKDAQDIAHEKLAPSHPERLRLAVKYSDFYYKILNDADGACKIAKQAFDDVVAENPALDVELAEGGLDTDKCRVARYMKVLRHRRNITDWMP